MAEKQADGVCSTIGNTGFQGTARRFGVAGGGAGYFSLVGSLILLEMWVKKAAEACPWPAIPLLEEP